jgi:hypothetical protein
MGKFRSRVMQQGDKNAPATMVRAMNYLFADHPEILRVYLDDIFIGGQTLEEHIRNLILVFEILLEHEFYLNIDKCQFLPKKMDVLGSIIDETGMYPADEKIKKIMDYPTPTNRRQLQTFMGMVNYLSQFTPNLATISSPLSVLQGSNTNWKWTHMHAEAFRQVKNLISNPTTLVAINKESGRPVYLITDASDLGIGAWIGQEDENGIIRPAGFHSRKFNDTQFNYSVTRKELFAIKDVMTHFRDMLYPLDSFTVITDHKPLVG